MNKKDTVTKEYNSIYRKCQKLSKLYNYLFLVHTHTIKWNREAKKNLSKIQAKDIKRGMKWKRDVQGLQLTGNVLLKWTLNIWQFCYSPLNYTCGIIYWLECFTGVIMSSNIIKRKLTIVNFSLACTHQYLPHYYNFYFLEIFLATYLTYSLENNLRDYLL